MPRRPSAPGTAEEWLERARSSLDLAKLPKPRRTCWEDMCFNTQQAAEKALKAIFQAHGWPFAYTHDLRELLDELGQHGLTIPLPLVKLPTLTTYAWHARYPGGTEHATRRDYLAALKLAQAAVAWAEREVKRAT